VLFHRFDPDQGGEQTATADSLVLSSASVPQHRGREVAHGYRVVHDYDQSPTTS